MKIFLATLGSRGDNEPFRALALEASSAGHEVFFAHTLDLAADPTAPYTDVVFPGRISEVIANQGVSPLKAILNYRSVMKPLMDGILDATTQHIIDIKPDVVVYHPKVLTAATAAHSIGAIALRAEMVPMLNPTAEFAPVGLPSWIPASWNKASYRLVNASLSAFNGKAKKLADALGVRQTEPDISLIPVSPTLISPPADWPEDVVITGAWHIPQRGQLDEELAQFLEFGPVLYAGFGSMKDSHGARRADTIVQAARSQGMRVLLVTGWGGLEPSALHEAAPDVLIRESVSHSEVLPHCAVAIHHGGSGTLHAMVRAGVPSVIMPFLGDQPWWADRLHRQGLGPTAISAKTTDYRKVASAIETARELRDVVQVAAFAMESEDGLAEAVRVIEEAEAGVHPFRAL
ncbi:glycosyltransferase [Pontimonas sp.]|nr:glycosyltransferase [Pontimonas sp.]MDB4607017.1 glycosyltransferase [Pontimonas sp.]